ncbi:hypothetical protein BpHYR1_026172, partial [Brachionus plicatilis]
PCAKDVSILNNLFFSNNLSQRVALILLTQSRAKCVYHDTSILFKNFELSSCGLSLKSVRLAKKENSRIPSMQESHVGLSLDFENRTIMGQPLLASDFQGKTKNKLASFLNGPRIVSKVRLEKSAFCKKYGLQIIIFYLFVYLYRAKAPSD